MRRDVWPRPVRCSLRSTFSLGARRIAVAAAAASARYSLVTADEPYIATPDGSASGISRDRLDGIRYLGYSRDAGPMTGPWGDQCADMRGAFHVPPPFMLRSPPRYSGARRPVPRVLILDSSLRVGLGRRREAESHLSSSPSWRGTLRLAKPMHRDNLPRREMSHTHTHTGATWTCVPVGVTRGGSHATFASRAAARVGRLRRGALRLAVLGALLLVLWRRARSQGGA